MEKELINLNLVQFDVEANSADEVIEYVADLLEEDGRLLDKEQYIADVKKREASDSTVIGFGAATPHAKSMGVQDASLTFIRLKNPIQWAGEEVSMVFQIAASAEGQVERHLEILAQLFRKLIYDDFRDQLIEAEDKQVIVDLLKGF